jgi:serine phosphatase RsbU (regulator of sigma subunit)
VFLESREIKIQQRENSNPVSQIVLPLTYQHDLLAVLAIYQENSPSPWSEDDIQLLEVVSEQASLALSQAKLYQRTLELAEQMQNELKVASQIQNNLLRQSWPEFETLRVQACCHPAREVGGDFFEVFTHPQGDIWVGLGDVSGKGVPAALFMASAISVMRRELSVETSPEPDQVMQNLNSILSDDLVSNNHFITMVVARYTPSTGHLAYANAGHIYPLVWSRLNSNLGENHPHLSVPVEPLFLKTRGIPLGILPVWRGKGDSLTLNPGDIFLVTSDGITEATVVQETSDGSPAIRSMLQQEGLWKLLQQQEKLNLDGLLAAIREHNPVQEDDQTILSLEVLLTDEN